MDSQVTGESFYGGGVAPLSGEHHPPDIEVHEHRHVVLAALGGGLIYPYLPYLTKVQACPRRFDVVFQDPPEPSVVLADHPGNRSYRHMRGELQKQRLE